MCRALGIGTLLTLVSACEGGPSAEPATTLVDSVGVTIVTSHVPRYPAGIPWTLGPAAVDLATSGTGPAHLLTDVWYGTRLPDRRLVVSDGLSSEIRIFTPEGVHERTLGGEGDGPGEFRWLGALAVEGPGRIASFGADHRYAAWSPDTGELLETRTFEAVYPPALTHWRLPGGYAGLTGWSSAQREAGQMGSARHDAFVVRWNDAGEIVDTLAATLGMDVWYGEQSIGTRVFGKLTHAVPWREGFLVSTGETLGFDAFDATGALHRIARVPDYDLRLDPSVVEDELRAAMGEMPEAVADRALEYYRAQPIPERRPAAGDVRVDPLGYVWMARYRGLPGRTPVAEWEIFDEEGRWLGSLETPTWKRVLEIGEDYVFAVVADELDVEHPTLFPLQRSPAG